MALALDEHDPHAHASGDTLYYGPPSAGSGQAYIGTFTLRATLSDATAGLAQVAFPDTTSSGATLDLAGAADTLRLRSYTFDASATFQGQATVQVADRAEHTASATFTLVRDEAPPVLSLSAAVEEGRVTVAWGGSDPGSGLAACALEVREGAGKWQALSTGCAGTQAYEAAEPGHLYTFRLTATDNVGNAASAEAQAGVPRVTKYYYHGGKRVAMRAAGVVYYLHTDHLGSTSLTTCGSPDGCGETPYGSVVARQLYHPYGEIRYSAVSGESQKLPSSPPGLPGTLPTDFGFTGQRHDGTGLIFMHARYYHPALGRFASADTVVPEPGNPQSLNRFAYVVNNPLRYVDPTGYFTEDAIIEYLKGVYGNQQTEDTKELVWRLVLRSWKSNEALWNMLSEATANDVLMYVNGNDQACFSRFLGEGQDKLWGIEGLPLPDIGGALGAKHDPNNDIGLPGVLQSDIVGLFSYTSRAHLELKYSGAGLGSWESVGARAITGAEVFAVKAYLKTVPTLLVFAFSGPAGAGAKAAGSTIANKLLDLAKGAAIGYGLSAFLGSRGLKPGNDMVSASNDMGNSMAVCLDRGVVVYSYVSRWEWPDFPSEDMPSP